MNRRVLLLPLPLLAGCALVSGLSQIGVEDDASVPMDSSVADTQQPDTMMPPVDSGMDSRDASADATIEATTTGSVACGVMKNCVLPNQECCRTDSGSGYSYSCITNQNVCAGLLIPCDDSTDCASQQGDVCCVHFTLNGNIGVANKVDCEPAQGCTLFNMGAILCDPNKSNQCPQNMVCTLSQTTLPGYYYCK